VGPLSARGRLPRRTVGGLGLGSAHPRLAEHGRPSRRRARYWKEDFNISPSRYIHIAASETLRPIAEILRELELLDSEAAKASAALRRVLEKAGASKA
jgi:hypothetical protein